LDKGLYGLGEAAKLWYDTISAALLGMGMTRNAKDPCVFVDDIMATCKNEDAIMNLHSELYKRYGAVTYDRGNVQSYLGQTFDVTASGKCDVTMAGYVSDLLDDQKVTGHATTPASEDLFDPGEGELLPPVERKNFHSTLAKLLYLSKRVRPDLLTAVTYLTTRTVGPTANDQMKLGRVLRYLNASKELGIAFSSDGVFSVVAYVDASYGVHPDYRSHTGLVLKVGGATIFVKSSKQKINTKSSTEAEVVGVSDSLSQALWTREFLQEQGYVMGPIRLKQDNKSSMVLLNKGMSTSERTRHIAIRFFFVKDRIETKEVVLEYLSTGEMIADAMTKPLQGELFRRMRGLLLNSGE
jgi:hypothetical protein